MPCGWKAQCSDPRSTQQHCPTRRGPVEIFGGMIAGTGDACGLRERNSANLLRDRASADISEYLPSAVL